MQILFTIYYLGITRKKIRCRCFSSFFSLCNLRLIVSWALGRRIHRCEGPIAIHLFTIMASSYKHEIASFTHYLEAPLMSIQPL